jgi:hypothetical protein
MKTVPPKQGQLLLSQITDWIQRDPNIKGAVLFGSMARHSVAAADAWSDCDVHLLATDTEKVASLDWQSAMPQMHLCHQAMRPVPGNVRNVRKLTLLYAEGEADIVAVPVTRMRFVRWCVRMGICRMFPQTTKSLANMSEVLSGGYRLLKGAETWDEFYAEIARMPRLRIGDREAAQMADSFLCDYLWIRQKLLRGEFIAAQRLLHRNLAETNISLLHELRLRRGLPSFQSARRVEMLLTARELQCIRVSHGVNSDSLYTAADDAYRGLVEIMQHLIPAWKVTTPMLTLLEEFKQAAP